MEHRRRRLSEKSRPQVKKQNDSRPMTSSFASSPRSDNAESTDTQINEHAVDLRRTGGRTTFEAKMEGSKAISFKSPAGAEYSMVVRKLAVTARSRLGDYRKQSTKPPGHLIKSRISERCETTDSLPPFLPTLQLKLVCVIERIHDQPRL